MNNTCAVGWYWVRKEGPMYITYVILILPSYYYCNSDRQEPPFSLSELRFGTGAKRLPEPGCHLEVCSKLKHWAILIVTGNGFFGSLAVKKEFRTCF